MSIIANNLKIYLVCNGCNRRLLDSQRLKKYLHLNNCIIVDKPDSADFIFFFASALNKVRIDESFDIIKRLKKFRGEIIILGCLMEVTPTEFRKFWKGKSLPIKDMDQIDEFFPYFSVHYKDIPPQNIPAPNLNIYRTISPAVFLKQGITSILSPSWIADKLYKQIHKDQKENYDTTFIWVSKGCPNLCSYCAERKVVGMSVSRPLREIAAEYKLLIEKGIRDFEFIGDDVGSYGIDIGSNLGELIKELTHVDKGYPVRWVIKHLHPKFIIKYKDELINIAKEGKIGEIICCFQSGSNRVLELMNRQHTIEEVIEVLTEFRRVLHDIKLATNIIVGFPTETDSEFQETLAVFDKVYFDRVHLIKYYDAEGSDSHAIFPKITDEVISQRIKLAKVFLKQRDIYYQTRD
jgi:tRNA A37 methylthiotransferase MiaB